MHRWSVKRVIICQLLVAVPCVVAIALETPVPERFLRPRNFNPHPLTDVVRNNHIDNKIDSYSLLKPINVPSASDIYAHYTQRRAPAYKDQEFRQYATLAQRLAYEANLEDYVAHAHHHQELDAAARVRPLVSGTAGYRLAARSFHHEQFSGTSENPVRHFTQVTHHSHGPYTSRSVQHRSDTFAQKPYSFSYAVEDERSGDYSAHAQANDGRATQGEYRVNLPDGRTQVVRYTADNGGYRADVSYQQTDAGLSLPNHHHHHVTSSPLYADEAAAGVVNTAFYGSQLIPGPKASTDDSADIQQAHLAFEQHLVYKRSHPARVLSRRKF